MLRKVFGVLIFCEHFEEDILLCNRLFIFQSYEFSKVSLLNTIFKFIGNLIIKRWFQVPYKTFLKNIFFLQNLTCSSGQNDFSIYLCCSRVFRGSNKHRYLARYLHSGMSINAPINSEKSQINNKTSTSGQWIYKPIHFLLLNRLRALGSFRTLLTGSKCSQTKIITLFFCVWEIFYTFKRAPLTIGFSIGWSFFKRLCFGDEYWFFTLSGWLVECLNIPEALVLEKVWLIVWPTEESACPWRNSKKVQNHCPLLSMVLTISNKDLENDRIRFLKIFLPDGDNSGHSSNDGFWPLGNIVPNPGTRSYCQVWCC